MKQKYVIIVVIIIFIFSTFAAYLSDTSQIRPVIITTQTMQVRHVASNVNISNTTEVDNKNTVKISNKTVNINKITSKINLSDNSKNIKLANRSSDIKNNNINFEKKLNYENKKTKVVEYEKPEPVEYRYKNLNWSEWRSEFLNRILDDTDIIENLNYYPTGTFIRFSFNVTNKGEIKNINLFAPQLKREDRLQFRMLLKSYENKDITVFPVNSKRKSVNVKSILVLDNSERRARPEDFYDRETVKVQK